MSQSRNLQQSFTISGVPDPASLSKSATEANLINLKSFLKLDENMLKSFGNRVAKEAGKASLLGK